MNEMLESVTTMLHIKKKSPIKLTIDILLNKYNFNAGETIEGKVYLETTKKILFTLKMKLVGTEAIFVIPNVNEKEIKNPIVDNNVTVLSNSCMKKGQAEIPFSMIIPFDSPPTLESANNFKIEYALVASLDLGGERILHSKKIFIHQMRNKDLPNTFVGKKASGKIIKGKESQILLRCVPSSNFIVPGGDKYILNMYIKNNTSKLIPRVLIRLEKIVKIKKWENTSLVAEADCREKITKDSPYLFSISNIFIYFLIFIILQFILYLNFYYFILILHLINFLIGKSFEQNVELDLKNVNNIQPTCTHGKALHITYQIQFVCEFEDGKQWSCKMPTTVNAAAFPGLIFHSIFSTLQFTQTYRRTKG